MAAGGPWRAGAVHRVLTNRAYLGRVVWRGQDRAGTHQPLVGEILFESVQEKLQARRQSPPRRLASENLLVGLTHCGRCGASMFVQRPGNAPKRHYRYYACAHRVESGSCDQPYIPAARLEGTVIGKIQELATRPDLIRPFLAKEIKRRKAASREREHRARGLERRLADIEARQGRLVDWLAETLPGKAAARKLNEKIEGLEEEKKRLAQELAEAERRADEALDGVTSEAMARHLAEFGYYLDQFNPGQRKELLEAVVQTVTVEGPPPPA
ncbi:MAG: recombinase zinc beta ribbon domain-containing protein [Gemmatimonadota bacterium]